MAGVNAHARSSPEHMGRRGGQTARHRHRSLEYAASGETNTAPAATSPASAPRGLLEQAEGSSAWTKPTELWPEVSVLLTDLVLGPTTHNVPPPHPYDWFASTGMKTYTASLYLGKRLQDTKYSDPDEIECEIHAVEYLQWWWAYVAADACEANHQEIQSIAFLMMGSNDGDARDIGRLSTDPVMAVRKKLRDDKVKLKQHLSSLRMLEKEEEAHPIARLGVRDMLKLKLEWGWYAHEKRATKDILLEQRQQQTWKDESYIISWLESHRGETFNLHFQQCCTACGAMPDYASLMTSRAPVTGTYSACAKCRLVRYCSKECQKTAWKRGHKRTCGRWAMSPFELRTQTHELLVLACHEYLSTHPAVCCMIIDEMNERFIGNAHSSYPIAKITGAGEDAFGPALLAAGMVPAVVAGMAHYKDDAVVQHIGCILISNISCNGGRGLVVKEGVSAPHHAGRAAALAAGAAKAVCSALKLHPGNADVLQWGCLALAHMLLGTSDDAGSYRLRVEVIEQDGLGCAMAVMADPLKKAAVFQASALMLTNALSEPLDSQIAMEQLQTALALLLDGCDAVRTGTMSLEGLEQGLGVFDHIPSLVCHAVHALLCLHERNALPPAWLNELPRAAATACAVLLGEDLKPSCHSEAARMLVPLAWHAPTVLLEGETIATLVTVISSRPAAVAEHVVRVLKNALKEPTCLDAALHAHALPTLLAVFQDAGATTALQTEIAKCILSFNKRQGVGSLAGLNDEAAYVEDVVLLLTSHGVTQAEVEVVLSQMAALLGAQQEGVQDQESDSP